MSVLAAPQSKKKLMTAEEFYEWGLRPENANGLHELVRGEVIELPSPGLTHGIVCLNIGGPLAAFVRQHRLGYAASNNSGVILERDPDTVRGPDVAVYKDAKAFKNITRKYGEVLPCLVVEIMSPSDRIGRMMSKIDDYLRAGIPLIWLVDFEEQNVTVYRPGVQPRVLRADQEITGEDVLPGFSCKIAEFFWAPTEEAEPAAASS